MLCFFLIGAGRQILEQEDTIPQSFKTLGKEQLCRSSLPSMKQTGSLLRANASTCVYDSSNQHWTEEFKTLLIFRDTQNKKLEVGEFIVHKASFERIPGPELPYHFDARRYYARQKIYLQAWLSSNEVFKLKAKRNCLAQFRAKILKKSQSILNKLLSSPRESAYMMALCFGQKADLDRQLKEAYGKLGLSHLLAVSGLHVGIIWLVGTKLFLILGRFNRKALRIPILVFALWFYVFLVGFSTSSVRSAVMISMYAFSRLISKQARAPNLVFASAFLTLLVEPSYAEDRGFWLSNVAVLTIVVFTPLLIQMWKPRFSIIRSIWQLTVVSIVAQLATTPLILYYFKSFPNFLIFTNLLFMPSIGLEISLGFLLIILSFYNLTNGLAYLFNAFLELKHKSIVSLAQFDHIDSKISLENSFELILAYSLLLTIVVLIFKSNFRMIKYTLMLCLIWVISLQNLGQPNTRVSILGSERGGAWIELDDGKLLVIADTSAKKWMYHTEQLGRLNRDYDVIHPDSSLSNEHLILEKGILVYGDTLIECSGKSFEDYSVP